MANKRLWLGMLVIALVFGFTALGCEEDDGKDGGGDDWVNVKSLAQLNGTWKYSTSGTGTGMAFYEPDDGGPDGEYTPPPDPYKDLTYKVETELIETINASAKTRTYTQKSIATYSGSGSSFNSLWSDMITHIRQETTTTTDTEHGITYTHSLVIDNSKHTITETHKAILPVTDEDVAVIGLQISKDGKKLRSSDAPDVIYYKQ